MPQRHRNLLTILGAMGLIAVTGGILGLLAANPDDQDFTAFFLIASPLGIVLPVHLTTEGNRRDPRKPGFHRRDDSDQEDPPGSV
jgi:hypothetical protein